MLEAVGSESVKDILLGHSSVDAAVVLTKAAVAFGKELAKAKSTGDPEQRLAIWKEALRDAKEMRKVASSIPPDGVADHTWRLVTSTWWMNLYAYSSTAVKSDEKITEMTKDDTIKKLDMVIAYIEHEIEVCEKKTKKE